MNSSSIGHTRWAIAEGYLPAPGPNGDNVALRSHESACILNAGDTDALVRITLFFKDREPAGPYLVTVKARRTSHIRFDELRDPAPVPLETEYSSLLESNVPIVVQHTRLDGRMGGISLMSTTAYGAG